MSDDAPVCPLCLRPIPPGVPQSRRHHLVPKLRGGNGGETVLLLPTSAIPRPTGP